MVARGDLGVEIPGQNCLYWSKELVKMLNCLKASNYSHPNDGKHDYYNISPRAEVTDVANAVLDGAVAVMLSAETSVGRYPVQVIKG